MVTPGRFSSRISAAQSGSGRRRWPGLSPLRANNRASSVASVTSSPSGQASPAALARLTASWTVERAMPTVRPISRLLIPLA